MSYISSQMNNLIGQDLEPGSTNRVVQAVWIEPDLPGDQEDRAW